MVRRAGPVVPVVNMGVRQIITATLMAMQWMPGPGLYPSAWAAPLWGPAVTAPPVPRARPGKSGVAAAKRAARRRRNQIRSQHVR